MKSSYDIIRRPIITERSMAGVDKKIYTFEVAVDANKHEIRKAVEEIFKVKVDKVNTIKVPAKPRRELVFHPAQVALLRVPGVPQRQKRQNGRHGGQKDAQGGREPRGVQCLQDAEEQRADRKAAGQLGQEERGHRGPGVLADAQHQREEHQEHRQRAAVEARDEA